MIDNDKAEFTSLDQLPPMSQLHFTCLSLIKRRILKIGGKDRFFNSKLFKSDKVSERIKHLGSDETKGLTKGQNVGQVKSRNLGIPNTGKSQ